MTPVAVLKQYFGYDSFRGVQGEIVDSIVSGHDVLALLPTGAGKSVCFQIPGLMFEGITVVISPLIALMKDQVFQLQQRGISSVALTGALGHDLTQVLSDVEVGMFKFVYVAPERLNSPQFLRTILRCDVGFVAIDEAHCITQWGTTFRPAYRAIPEFISRFKKRPVVAAFTATAPQHVADDILTNLQLNNPVRFGTSLYRPNLRLRVLPCVSSTHQKLLLLRLITKHIGTSGIIYVSSRTTAEQLALWLNQLFGSDSHQFARPYHAHLDSQVRSEVQDLFIGEQVKVIIATTAFGMGVDMPSVRFVIHYHPPSNLEEYAQQVGRAGRDRQTSTCYTLLYKPQFSIVASMTPRSHMHHLQQLISFLCNTHSCRYKALLKHFGETEFRHCYNCDVCHPELPNSHFLNQGLAARDTLHTLLTKRQKLANQHRASLSAVCQDTTLSFLSSLDLKTRSQLQAIPGVGTGILYRWNQSKFLTHP